jgi:hypothetical protein
MVTLYNKMMGGVDSTDRYISDLRSCMHAKRWYWPIVRQLLDIIRVAAFVSYRHLHPEDRITQLQFTRAVVRGLLQNASAFSPRPGPSGALPIVPQHVQHFLASAGKQGKCAQCKKNTRLICIVCNVLVHKNCSMLYHANFVQ